MSINNGKMCLCAPHNMYEVQWYQSSDWESIVWTNV